MKRNLYLLIVLFISIPTFSQQKDFFKESDTFFKTHVSNGLVDYKSIKKQPKKLNALIAQAQQYSVSLEQPERYKAFWINTYNLLVIQNVVKHYPLQSPLAVKGFFEDKLFEYKGSALSLNDVEHKLLRAKFQNDPRLHFVLVCAGLGCPPLISEAYTPENVEQLLTQQTALAMNNSNFTKIDMKKKKVGLSQLFEWYADDFKQAGSNFIAFVNKYSSEKIPQNYSTYFYEYDWKLNQLK